MPDVLLNYLLKRGSGCWYLGKAFQSLMVKKAVHRLFELPACLRFVTLVALKM
jgi:hypothetical protein